MRSEWRFNMKGKLTPRYVGPFKMLEIWNEVAYQMELPKSLGGVYDVFHVSRLKEKVLACVIRADIVRRIDCYIRIHIQRVPGKNFGNNRKG